MAGVFFSESLMWMGQEFSVEENQRRDRQRAAHNVNENDREMKKNGCLVQDGKTDQQDRNQAQYCQKTIRIAVFPVFNQEDCKENPLRDAGNQDNLEGT